MSASSAAAERKLSTIDDDSRPRGVRRARDDARDARLAETFRARRHRARRARASVRRGGRARGRTSLERVLRSMRSGRERRRSRATACGRRVGCEARRGEAGGRRLRRRERSGTTRYDACVRRSGVESTSDSVECDQLSIGITKEVSMCRSLKFTRRRRARRAYRIRCAPPSVDKSV